MPTYNYKARDRFGELSSGTLDCKDEAELVDNLDKLGYSVISVSSPDSKNFSLTGFFEQFQQIKKQEVIIFTRQLATLLRTGMALSPSLTTLCEQTVNKKFKQVLETVRESVQGGLSLSESLAKYPQVFPELL